MIRASKKAHAFKEDISIRVSRVYRTGTLQKCVVVTAEFFDDLPDEGAYLVDLVQKMRRDVAKRHREIYGRLGKK